MYLLKLRYGLAEGACSTVTSMQENEGVVRLAAKQARATPCPWARHCQA